MKEDQKKSFDSFFKKEYFKLLNFVRKNFEYRVSDASPEDIIQDVALSLLKRIDVDSQVENLAAYVYRSLRNKISDTERQAKLNISIDHFDTVQYKDLVAKSITDESENNQNQDTEELKYEMLYEALSQLKPDEQAIIMLTEFEGKTFNELSEKLNIPIGTLLSRKHRALSKLSKIINSKTSKKTLNFKDYGNETKIYEKQVLRA